MSDSNLFIAGASVRAAAMSAKLAGLRPLAADLFADADLQSICPTLRITDYPRRLIDAARWACDSCRGEFFWMYSGALENHPQIVQQMCHTVRLGHGTGRLLGNPADVLRRIRHPLLVAQTLAKSEVCVPRASMDPPPVDTASWLQKPIRSAAGHGISFFCSAKPQRHCYYQQFVEGQPVSATFVANAQDAMLLGVSRQLIGYEWAGCDRFRYCGNVGPEPTTPRQLADWRLIGATLAGEFKLQGLFGVDAIVADDRIWVIEVNPRYTASVEILEAASQQAALSAHVAACTTGVLPSKQDWSAQERVMAKAVLFAKSDIVVGRRFSEYLMAAAQQNETPRYADIPNVGDRIGTGHPIVTVFSDGCTAEDATHHLRQQAAEVYEMLKVQ